LIADCQVNDILLMRYSPLFIYSASHVNVTQKKSKKPHF